ncbi:hypothetical protein KSB_48930 [Ktedonobacter robiniae]|uniref:Uncharacterized protein n=1 Tax=Ktedonobacter robiniae TaxID=2778365 RepID=A0ABQ3UUQ3_9CHLR|nr:hypothetical protein KSB_48930 [Ktedonobacter robiniae]
MVRCRLMGDSEGVGKQDHAGQESNDEEHSMQLTMMLTSKHDGSPYAQLTIMLTSKYNDSPYVQLTMILTSEHNGSSYVM